MTYFGRAPLPSVVTDFQATTTSATTYTLPFVVADAASIDVYLDGSFVQPYTGFTVQSTTLNIPAVVAGKSLYVKLRDQAGVRARLDYTYPVASGSFASNTLGATFNPAVAGLVNNTTVLVSVTGSNPGSNPVFSPNGLPAREIVDKRKAIIPANGIFGEVLLRYDSVLDKWVTVTDTLSGVTAPQFDNDESLATTDFVQRALGNSSGAVSFVLGGSVSLVAADSGKTVNIAGTVATTITLPKGATLPYGATFEFFQSNTQATTIQRYGADVVYVNSGTVPSLTLYSGDSLKLVWIGAWVAVSGTAQVQYSTGRFSSSLAASGYQKLPSGLIIQWGTVTTSASADVTVTFPVAFPTTCLSFNATATNSVTRSTVLCSGVMSLSSVPIGGYTSNTAARVAEVALWVAIGY